MSVRLLSGLPAAKPLKALIYFHNSSQRCYFCVEWAEVEFLLQKDQMTDKKAAPDAGDDFNGASAPDEVRYLFYSLSIANQFGYNIGSIPHHAAGRTQVLYTRVASEPSRVHKDETLQAMVRGSELQWVRKVGGVLPFRDGPG